MLSIKAYFFLMILMRWCVYKVQHIKRFYSFYEKQFTEKKNCKFFLDMLTGRLTADMYQIFKEKKYK